MKGCARYQNAIDHVEKSILEVTKQIESTRHLTGGADHTMLYVPLRHPALLVLAPGG